MEHYNELLDGTKKNNGYFHFVFTIKHQQRPLKVFHWKGFLGNGLSTMERFKLWVLRKESASLVETEKQRVNLFKK